ncbi:MAG: aminopeptidase N, partial [Pseudomonadota bacterium]
MRESSPQSIYLKDYTPPDYLIDTVALKLFLDAADTRVLSTLVLVKNPDAVHAEPALELAGENIVLASVSLDDRLLSDTDYRLTAESLTLPKVPQDRRFTVEIETHINPAA